MTSRPSTAPLKVRPLSTGRLRPRIVQVDNSARTDLSGGSSAPRRAREIDTSAGSRGQYEKEVLPPLSVLLQPFGIEEGELNRMNMKDRRKRVLRGIVETLGRDRGETERQNENVHRGSDGDSRDYLDYVPPPILEHQPADIFSWLRLNTKYPNLRALLRARLIEVLTEGGNAAKIREKVEAIDAEQTGNTDRFIRPQDRRIEREYLQHPRSRRGEESSRGSTFRTPHPQFVSNPAKIEAHLLSQVHLSKDKYTPQNSDQQTFSKYRLDGQKISEKWNKKDEEIYKTSRKLAFSSTHGQYPSSPLIDCSLIPFILQHVNTKNTKEMRSELIDRLIGGEELRPCEIRFLTYTSSTLNKFLDRHLYQKSVDMLDPDMIEELEILIAEEILSGYYLIRNAIRDKRKKWLEMKNREFEAQQSLGEIVMRDRESDSATLYHRRRIQESARNMSERMLKKKEEKKCLNLAEKYAKKFIANALRKKEKTVKACIGRITDKEKTAISTFHGKLPIKEYRATIHPNSKLVIAEEDKMYEKFITTTADQNLTKKQVEKAYRMQTLSDQKLIKQQRFKEIYSTGPIKPITQPTKALKHKAAVVIQKFWRGFLARRNYVSLKRAKSSEKILKRKNLAKKKAETAFFKSALRAFNFSKVNKFEVKPVQKEKKDPTKEMMEAILKNLGNVKSSLTKCVDVNAKKLPKATLGKQNFLFSCAKLGRTDALLRCTHIFYPKDVNVVDDKGNYPLYYAARAGNATICDFLIKKGSIINFPGKEGNTPLHMAFGSQDIHTCVLLLSREANLNALNNVGQTPIAFGTPDLLTSLGVFNGVAYSTKGSAVPLAVDNNKLWKMKKQATPMIERIAMNDLVERYHMLMKDKPSPEPSTDLHEQPEGQS